MKYHLAIFDDSSHIEPGFVCVYKFNDGLEPGYCLPERSDIPYGAKRLVYAIRVIPKFTIERAAS